MKQEQLDLIYFCGCEVNGITPDKTRITAMDLTAIHDLAKMQTLSAITYYAVEKTSDKSNAELMKTWRQERDMAIRKNLSLDFDRNKIFAEFEKNGIRHMALKGAILKDMYPKLGMRQMADNDVLYDKKHQQEVHDIFLENGYFCEDYDRTHHDVYMKEPFYNFEMHSMMLNPMHKLSFYYEDIWDRVKLTDAKRFEYHFTDEDFYIFMIVYAYKHFSNRGTGLRTLLDFYVYNKAKYKTLDYKYIGNECDKIGLRSFEKMMRVLSWKTFAKPDAFDYDALTPQKQKIMCKFFVSKTYGTTEQKIRNRLIENGADDERLTKLDKLKYILRRAFPDRDFMKMWCNRNFRAALKYPILFPIAYPYRMIYISLTFSKKAKSEINILKKM